MSDITSTVNLKVTAMSCGGCVKTVTDALQNVKGVAEAKVDLDSGTAEVKVSGAAVDPSKMILAVKLAGFEAEVTD